MAKNHSYSADKYQHKSSGIGGAVRDFWRKEFIGVPSYKELSEQERDKARKEIKRELKAIALLKNLKNISP